MKMTMELLFQMIQSTEVHFLEHISEFHEAEIYKLFLKKHVLYKESITFSYINFNGTTRDYVLGKGNLTEDFTEDVGVCSL